MYDMKRAARVAAPLSASIVLELRRLAEDEIWVHGFRSWQRCRSRRRESAARTCSPSRS